LLRGSAEWQWVPALQPRDTEAQIHKQFNSAFEDTALETTLERLAATHIVLAGAATNWCIRATAYAALERGYDLTLVQDAHTTGSMDFGDGARIEASAVVDELNVAMRWLRYPGRTNRVMAVDEVEFRLAAPTT